MAILRQSWYSLAPLGALAEPLYGDFGVCAAPGLGTPQAVEHSYQRVLVFADFQFPQRALSDPPVDDGQRFQNGVLSGKSFLWINVEISSERVANILVVVDLAAHKDVACFLIVQSIVPPQHEQFLLIFGVVRAEDF